MTRMEKAERDIKLAIEKKNRLKKEAAQKAKERAEAKKRREKIGLHVEKLVGVKITDFSAFDAYISQYAWKIKETQTSPSTSGDQI